MREKKEAFGEGSPGLNVRGEVCESKASSGQDARAYCVMQQGKQPLVCAAQQRVMGPSRLDDKGGHYPLAIGRFVFATT
jgi:hypothetical protein